MFDWGEWREEREKKSNKRQYTKHWACRAGNTQLQNSQSGRDPSSAIFVVSLVYFNSVLHYWGKVCGIKHGVTSVCSHPWATKGWVWVCRQSEARYNYQQYVLHLPQSNLVLGSAPSVLLYLLSHVLLSYLGNRSRNKDKRVCLSLMIKCNTVMESRYFPVRCSKLFLLFSDLVSYLKCKNLMKCCEALSFQAAPPVCVSRFFIFLFCHSVFSCICGFWPYLATFTWVFVLLFGIFWFLCGAPD